MTEIAKTPTSQEIKQQLVNKYSFIGFKQHVIMLEQENIKNALKEANDLDKEYLRLVKDEEKLKAVETKNEA